MRPASPALSIVAILALVAACGAPTAPPRSASPVAPAASAPPAVDLEIRDVRLFDGVRVTEHATVDVRNGTIATIRGADDASPSPTGPATDVVEGHGKTLLPGLIDAHAHVWNRAQLVQSLAFGVSTVLDQFSSPAFDATMRGEQSHGVTDRADLFSAGILVTSPKGHGTEYGFEIPTLAPGDDERAFVDARIAEGSDWIKIIYDDGRAIHLRLPTITSEQLRRVIAAAHARSKLAVVHVSSLAEAKDAIDRDADGLAHLFFDAPATPEIADLLAQKGSFVIATLAVTASFAGKGVGPTLLADPLVSPYLAAESANTLRRVPKLAIPEVPSAAKDSIARLEAAHVPILVGTDAPNDGTTYGATVHQELALLVAAGLTPTEALIGATSSAAARFHLDDRGRIATGVRADMVLVDGDPTADIRSTLAIEGVWKDGLRFDREAWRASCTRERASTPAPPPSSVVHGLISDFDDGTLHSKFGGDWTPSTDSIAGGASTVDIAPLKGGANGTQGALGIEGTIAPGLPYAWAGAMLWLGSADASSSKELVFWAKGDPGTYRAMLFTRSHGRMPLIRSFDAGRTWKEYRLALSSFGATDAKDLTAVLIAGGPRSGRFSLGIDQIELR